jgi:DNA invertase Pin-like site-specific DNA recombinase
MGVANGSRTTALVYLRVSTEEQERTGVGLAVQRASCREYIRLHQWRPGAEYIDVMSGDRDERPRYQAMLAEVRGLRTRGKSAIIVVASLDRLGRRLLEAVRCRDEMKSLDVAVHSVRDGGEVPDLVANILSAVAQDEIRRRRERMQLAYRSVVAAGWYPPGACPRGYLLRPATRQERAAGAPRFVIDVDPPGAATVNEVFRRAATGEKLADIARAIFHAGLASANGRPLHRGIIGQMLRNPAYIARLRTGGSNMLDHARGRWPALVDDATWARVHDRRLTPLWGRARGRTLLAGFIRCVRCGSRGCAGQSGRTGRPSHPVYRFYKCVSRHGCEAYIAPQPALDRIIVRRVRRELQLFADALDQNPDAVSIVWKQFADACDKPLAAAALRPDVDRARDRLARATELLAEGVLELADYEVVRDALEGGLHETQQLDLRRRKPIVPLATVVQSVHVWVATLAGTETWQR